MCISFSLHVLALSWALFLCAVTTTVADDRAKLDYFENNIRPLLVEKCASCHGEDVQENGFRVDSRDAVLQGGQRGEAIVPGDAEASLLYRVVSDKEEDLVMPPEGDMLSEEEQTHLAHWINDGVVWSGKKQANADTPLARMEAIHRNHWAYQPIKLPEVPQHTGSPWPRGAIDQFVLRGLLEKGLTPSAEADRRTLIRRAYFDLIGLPPSYEAVEAFVADHRKNAYERLIERLLERPEYGQRWGRHWLDVARYSDTRGHTNVPGTEIRYPYAWTYRDYVIDALNEDLPYDQFITEQLAADLFGANNKEKLAALGFLTVGRRFLDRQHRILGERVDLVSRGLMGITIMCAKCHDHKFDPLSMRDFYALYGIFENAAEPLAIELPEMGPQSRSDPEKEQRFEPLLNAELDPLQHELAALRRTLIVEELQQQAEYYLALVAAAEMGTDFGKVDLGDNDRLSLRGIEIWQQLLQQDTTLARFWETLLAIEEEEGEVYAHEVTRVLAEDEGGNRLLHEKLVSEKPQSASAALRVIGRVLGSVYERWEKLQKLDPGDQGFADPAAEEIRQLLLLLAEAGEAQSVEEQGQWFLGREPESLLKKSHEIESVLVKYRELVPRRAMAVVENPLVRDTAIHIRGNPKKLGPVVPRGFYELFAEDCEVTAVKEGSGRAELARWITHAGNPLTARVIANRIWGWHFGQHLVETPSDFGTRSAAPTHPQLLDYLAATLRDGGWSLKDLHRQIMHSATYRQQSLARQEAMAIDPDNQCYWRKNRRRLEFEPMRDAMLAVTGELDTALAGPPVDDIDSPRRSIYLLHDRRSMAPVLPTFDVPAANATLPKRSETTVPQQALYLMNNGFVTRRAVQLSRHISSVHSGAQTDRRITALYRRIYGRDPSADELKDAGAFIAEAASAFFSRPQSAREIPPEDACWSYGTGRFDTDQQTVHDFQPLPYFDGRRWWQRASHSWQDAYLGADGGRPGHQTAVIRRWQAPPGAVGARYLLRGNFKGGPHFGDGVDIHVVSSRQGLLKTFPRDTAESMDIHLENLEIEPGDSLDLVVTPRGENTFDDFSWSLRIVEVGINAAGTPFAAAQWRSEDAFQRSVPFWEGGMDPWEQLAQVLLISNAFMFVD